jgi:hypothetical protein
MKIKRFHFARYITLSLFALVLTCQMSRSQDVPITIYTPQGTPVGAYLIEDTLSEATKMYLHVLVEDMYVQCVTVIGEASSSYNCHGYAWYMTEGGSYPEIWMDWPGAYWEDESYVEVPDSSTASKAFFYSGGHSAVTGGSGGQLISKWGEWPLVEHSRLLQPLIVRMMSGTINGQSSAFLEISQQLNQLSVLSKAVRPLLCRQGATSCNRV